MIKVKDGYAKLVGTTASGSASHILLSNGGVKAVSDFAKASALDNYLPLSGGRMNSNSYIRWNDGHEGNDFSDWNSVAGETGLKIISSVVSTSNAPGTYSTALHVKGRYGFQLASIGGDNSKFYIRNIRDINDWCQLIHSRNINSFAWTSSNDGSGSGLDADMLDGKHLSSFITYELATDYVGASFNSEDLAKKAASTYIEYWDGAGGWFNSRWGLVLAISGFHRVGSSDSYVLLGGGGHKALSDFAMASAYVKKAGDTMTGRLTMTGEGIIVTTATTSNYRAGVEFYKGTAADTTYSYEAQIGWHNTGGDGTGSICILPYATSTQPWGGSVGLFITKTDLKYNGNSVWHSGNDGSGSGLDADTVDSCHKDDFLRRTATLGYLDKFVLENIPKGVTQVGSIGWTDYQNYPYAGGLWMTLRGASSLSTALILFPSYSMSSPPILYSSIDGRAWQGGHQLAYTSQIPTTMAWGSITGKPSTFTPSSHTHDDRYYTESEADSRFINHSGDTMTGPLTFANGTWNVVGDDAAIGDYNAAGMLGLKSINNNIPGIGFHNSSNTLLGRLQANGSNLLWNDQMLLHSSNWSSYIGVDGYVMRTWTIDATGLDLNTWYPVTMGLSSLHWTRIEVKETLSSRSKPSWSTHGAGFHVTKIWHSLGYGWGTTQAVSQRFVLQSDYCWCDTDPVRGIGLLSNSSTEYVYVRGGGKYYVSTSHNVVPTLRTSTYTISSQSIGPTTSTPAGITAMYSDKSIHAPHFYESSDIRYKTIINNLAIKANQLANLPLFDFKWLDNEDLLNTGTSAQAVQELLPYIVSGTDKLTLDYGVLGTIAGITACRELTEQEKEINELKEQIKFLKDEINNLKTNKLWQS